MVKGTTKQVLVVKGADASLFEQAIFLVRDDVVAQGGVSEDALLQEARRVCQHTTATIPWIRKALWSGIGAGATGLIWLITILL